ncbi:hypothetical protein FACS189475_02230 [Betaproteobacteria bacterium]|nr:hypothetical protein FACS189475_02230 [Betaproteobacteria bacterium]
MNKDIFWYLTPEELDEGEKIREERLAALRAKFQAEYSESGAAYHAGVDNAEMMLEGLAYTRKILDEIDPVWRPDIGLPPLSWQYLRGLVDTLSPVFERTINEMEHLVTSGLLSGRMKKKAPAIIRKVLRQAILDDLRDHQEKNFEKAKTQKRRAFNPYSKEW